MFGSEEEPKIVEKPMLVEQERKKPAVRGGLWRKRQTVSTPMNVEDEDFEIKEEDAYTSPFLPGAKVEKRPLGGGSREAEPERTLDKTEEKVLLEAPEPMRELPADDGGEGELVAQLPATTGDKVHPEEEAEADKPETKSSKEDEKVDHLPSHRSMSRPVMANTMITSQYRAREDGFREYSNAPFAASAMDLPTAEKERKSLAWLWIILAAVLVGAGIGVGVWLYGSVL
jgi:hypothetical protein